MDLMAGSAGCYCTQTAAAMHISCSYGTVLSRMWWNTGSCGFFLRKMAAVFLLSSGRHLWMFCIFLVYVITYDRMGIPAEPANRYALSGDLPLACISDRSHQCSGQEYRPCGISYRFIEIIRWDFLIRNSHHLIQFLDTVNTIEI